MPEKTSDPCLPGPRDQMSEPAMTDITTDPEALPPAVGRFVAAARGHFLDRAKGEDLWRRIAGDLEALLRDPDLVARAGDWPETRLADGGPSNLLFYEDLDYGFVLNALVKAPGAATSIHDHGPSWTLYGVLTGGERIERFRRTDDNPKAAGPAVLAAGQALDVAAGYLDVVAPWEIHRETNGAERTASFIVRSQRSGTFRQYRYAPDDGAITEYQGPAQIPYALA